MDNVRIQTVTSATGEPISLGEVKRGLRLSTGLTLEDATLNILIGAARRKVEETLNCRLMKQTVKAYFQNWPSGDYIDLPYGWPLSTAVDATVKYTMSASTEVTWSTTAYQVDYRGKPGRLVLGYGESWPSETLNNMNPISVQYRLGWDASTQIPPNIRMAIRLMVGHMYENREDSAANYDLQLIPNGALAHLYPERRFKF